MLVSLSLWCFRNPKRVVAAWIVVMVGGFGLSNVIGAGFDGSIELPESESAVGFEALEDHFGGLGAGLTGTIVVAAEQGIDHPGVQGPMTELFDAVADIENVNLVSPYMPGFGEQQVSDDGTLAFAAITFDKSVDEVESGEVGLKIKELLPEIDGVTIELGGTALSVFEPPESELVGLAFAIVVLIISFGSVLGMGLPIGVAVAGVGTGVATMTLLSHVQKMPDFAVTIGAMIGLGVGIDYALFIVTRYREDLHRTNDPEHAARIAMDTAGRAVIFAGLTVVVSLMGMLIIGLSFVSGLGIAAAVTVSLTMLASTTLLPAFLGMAGPRIELTRWRGLLAAGFVAVGLVGVGLKISALMVGVPIGAVVLLAGFVFAPLKREVPPRRQVPVRETFSYRWSRAVQAHPWRSVTISIVVLGVLAAPLFSLQLGFSDEGNFAPETTTRRAYDMLADGFGPGFNGPLIVTMELNDDSDDQAIEGTVAAIEADPGVDRATPPVPDTLLNPLAALTGATPEAYLVQVIPTTAPQDRETNDTIKRLREEVIPAAVDGTELVVSLTGFTAAGIDFSVYLAERMLVFMGAVLALSFLLLMMVFRSVLVPLKAVFMNVLSIASAYGIVVAIFQWGWFGSVLNLEPAPIEPFIPMMMFAIVFGLSMDYEVFLLSRVKEEYDRTGDPVSSVADGLAATARVITAAAAIMIVVFGSFLFEDHRVIRLFGIGLASAVFLDATLVRMLLVPATMELLGSRNWWLPAWLDKVIPHLNVEGSTEVIEELAAMEPAEHDHDAGGEAAADLEPIA